MELRTQPFEGKRQLVAGAGSGFWLHAIYDALGGGKVAPVERIFSTTALVFAVTDAFSAIRRFEGAFQ